MRVSLIRSAQGEVDGIQLGRFQAGLTYDVPATLATYLITSGLAHPVMDDAPARRSPQSGWRSIEDPMAVAADIRRPGHDRPMLAADRGSTH